MNTEFNKTEEVVVEDTSKRLPIVYAKMTKWDWINLVITNALVFLAGYSIGKFGFVR